ncbi:hypothetical protein Tco_0911714 [Tanacetum coccineum]|uniref:Uncharacterized protein n=1 Tax=Tanacetum coccineum TaxID=301880 RepID=A0ABQ5D2X8_9ASTR
MNDIFIQIGTLELEDLTPSHIRSDLDALHRRVKHIEEEDVRADNKRLKMMLDCSENRTRDAWRENDRATWHYHHLRRWSIMVENLLPPRHVYDIKSRHMLYLRLYWLLLLTMILGSICLPARDAATICS